MDRRSSATTQSPQPTERDQFWLDHEAAQAASGQNAKEKVTAFMAGRSYSRGCKSPSIVGINSETVG